MRPMLVRSLCMLGLVLGPAGCWATHPQPRSSEEVGFPDSDLPLFAPASRGMTWTWRTYDLAGHPVGSELDELVDFDDSAGPSKKRLYQITEDVENGASQITHFSSSIFKDRIEGVTEETGRVKVLLRTPLKPGTTWTYPRGPGAGEERRAIVAIEDVCTTWGYFPRAIKVVSTILGPRPSGGEALRTRTEEWFVKGLGRVQVIARVDGKPEMDIKTELEGLIDPSADEPYTPSPCPS